jgi:TonB-dependent SusC/RagA subfamily outer membrane receptor
VRIRGGSGGGEPLYVVDGLPLPEGFSPSRLNADDVERIDVLKDWGSTAVYGARGANGVIVIRTRRGHR